MLIGHLFVDLNPEWDQIIYTPIHSLRENLLLEVMDYQHLTKDRSLGTVELSVKDLIRTIRVLDPFALEILPFLLPLLLVLRRDTL